MGRRQATGEHAAQRDVCLADLTTLRLGGPARAVVEADSADAIVAAVAAADAADRPVLLVGGGSNLVVADDGFPGDVVLLRSRGVSAEDSGAHVMVTVAAGEPWDDFVVRAIGERWAGLECLSGIPGLVGATPVQNVGAYGAEVAQTVTEVGVYDRRRAERRVFRGADCRFAYRTSVFKRSDRYVVLSVTFALARGDRSAPIRYADLARALDVPMGATVALAEARAAVLAQRRLRGMVLDPADHDTWSVGSFFTNPIVSTARYDAVVAAAGDGVPHWPDRDARVKLSAAWLIERAGFGKGYGDGPATLSTKHTLAITNRGEARTADVVRLAREIRDRVADTWGIELVPEPSLVGVEI